MIWDEFDFGSTGEEKKRPFKTDGGCNGQLSTVRSYAMGSVAAPSLGRLDWTVWQLSPPSEQTGSSSSPFMGVVGFHTYVRSPSFGCGSLKNDGGPGEPNHA